MGDNTTAAASVVAAMFSSLSLMFSLLSNESVYTRFRVSIINIHVFVFNVNTFRKVFTRIRVIILVCVNCSVCTHFLHDPGGDGIGYPGRSCELVRSAFP